MSTLASANESFGSWYIYAKIGFTIDEKLSFWPVLGDSIRQVGRYWIFFVGVGLANILLALPGTYLVTWTDWQGSLPLVYGLHTVNAVLACLIYGTIIDFTHQALKGPNPSVRSAVGLAVRRWPALVWTMIVRWFWLFLGFALLVVPGVIWGYRQMLCWVVTTVEGISGPAALRRAQGLVWADPTAYSIVFAQWLLCMLLLTVPSMLVTFRLVHEPAAVRLGFQWALGLLTWLVLGVYYFSMMRVYGHLRARLDRTPEEEGIGFSPTFEL